jgi:hypothetical protein
MTVRLPVSDAGVVIPKAWFGHASEVELREHDGEIVIVPVPAAEKQADSTAFSPNDPIWSLGNVGVDIGVSDASVNLDEYLYDDPHRLRG